MTAHELPENYAKPSNVSRFSDVKGNEWRPEKSSDEDDEINNSSEWSDSEANFLNSPPGSRAQKDSFEGQDMTNEDAIYWEKEISDLKESLKRFQINLAEGRNTVIEDVFRFQPSEEYKKADDMKASLMEIEKMDTLLKMKDVEAKKARLNRLQVEEESRTILAKLTNIAKTERIKMNSEEFLKLLCEEDKPNTGLAEEETARKEENDPDDAKEGKKSDGSEDKNFRAIATQPKPKFVERNIQLAKCGRGVLSLTDEEKLRIESLLVDMGDPKPEDGKNQKMEHPIKPDIYALDDESKSFLSEIDQRLEAFSRDKTPEGSRINLNLLENLKVEEELIKKTGNEKAKKKKRLPNRLSAINKLLNDMNSVTDKEISPLPPEDLNRLIQEASKSTTEVEPRPSPEIIAELVSNAKVLMPKFKYRFEEG